jgi:hypothetical protein
MSRRSRVTSALVLAEACSTGVLALQPLAQTASTPHGPLERPGASSDGAGAAAGKDTKAVFDIREGTTRAQRKVRGDRAAALEAAAPVRRLAKALGPQSVIDLDPLTGTPRQVSRLDGMLTEPSPASATSVALGYVRAHADVFGLSATYLAQLELARDYVDIAGIHHLAFVQKVDGVPLFGNGLEANVTKGQPAHQRDRLAGAGTARAGDPACRAERRRGDPLVQEGHGREAGGFRQGGHRQAGALPHRRGHPSCHPDRHHVRRHTDAGRGRRRVRACAGGRTRTLSLNRPGWLPKGAVVLYGNNVHYSIAGILPGTYLDVVVGGAGYDSQVSTVSVGRGTTTKNWAVRRDWAAASGGASVTDCNRPDYTNYGCGPSALLDQSLGTGWGSDAGPAKHVLVKLPTSPPPVAQPRCGSRGTRC